MRVPTVLHEQKAKRTASFNALFGGILIAMVLGGLYLYDTADPEAKEGAIVVWGAAILTALIIWLILPTGFHILEDRIRIRFRLYKFDIRFDSIKAIEYPMRSPSWGINFATSFNSKDIIKIKRGHVRDVTISPEDPRLFIDNLPAEVRVSLVAPPYNSGK
jgi:hypothetical protein